MLKHLLLLCLFAAILGSKAELKSSTAEIVVKTAGESTATKEINLLKPKPLSLKATQSSKIYVYLSLEFTKSLEPEFVAGRLVHS